MYLFFGLSSLFTLCSVSFPLQAVPGTGTHLVLPSIPELPLVGWNRHIGCNLVHLHYSTFLHWHHVQTVEASFSTTRMWRTQEKQKQCHSPERTRFRTKCWIMSLELEYYKSLFLFLSLPPPEGDFSPLHLIFCCLPRHPHPLPAACLLALSFWFHQELTGAMSRLWAATQRRGWLFIFSSFSTQCGISVL